MALGGIPESFLQELRDRVPVSEVAQNFTQLVRAGRELKGKSPWSDDRTPSFFVNDDKKMFSDFSSGKAGDVFRLIMEVRGVGFREAVDEVAGLAGLEVPSGGGGKKGRNMDGMDRARGMRPADDDLPEQRGGNGYDHDGPPPRQEKKPAVKREIVKTYDYHDKDGALIYQVVRFEPKGFAQRRPYNQEPGIWAWGLGKGPFVRKKDKSDWVLEGKGRYPEDGYVQRMEYEEDAEHTLFDMPALLEEIAAPQDERMTIFLCYTPDTEVLTEKGWVPFPDLTSEHEVANWWPENGQITFSKPAAIQRFDYKGDLVHIKSVATDLLVTPDHRQPVDYKTKGVEYPIRVIQASAVRRQQRVPVSGIFKGMECGPSEAQARLIVAWLADGCWEPRGHYVSWNLKKQRKCERLRELLKALSIPWAEHTYDSTPGWISFRVSKASMVLLTNFDKPWTWEPSAAKTWPEACHYWPVSSRQAALYEIAKWDGDSGVGSVRLFTGDRRTADRVSSMAAISGWYSATRVDRRDGRNDSFVVNMSPQDRKLISRPPSRVPYDGPVHCCSVESTFLIVRRNGKVAISGNCEGEKDVFTMKDWGFFATTNSGGAKHWQPHFADLFEGCDVVIPVDGDEPGRVRGETIAAQLHGRAKRVRILELPTKKGKGGDVTDWKDEGGTKEQLHKILDKLPEWAPPPPDEYKSKFGAIPMSKLWEAASPYEWLIKGILPARERVLIFGEPQSGKSFAALDMAMHVARGVDFRGRKTRQAGVIYCAFEGGKGFRNRAQGYFIGNDIPRGEQPPVVILTRDADLFGSDEVVKDLIAEIKHWSETMLAATGVPVGLIVFDTISACTPGMNENAGEEISKFLGNTRQIGHEIGATMMLVHHKPKHGDTPRGSGKLTGDLETTIEVGFPPNGDHDENDRPIRKMKILKQREGEAGAEFPFVLPRVEVSRDADGDAITTCFVTPPGGAPRAKGGRGFKLNPNTRELPVFQALVNALIQHGEDPPTGLVGAKGQPVPAGLKVVKSSIAKTAYMNADTEQHEDDDDEKAGKRANKAFEFVLPRLRSFGLIDGRKPYIWWTGKPIANCPETQDLIAPPPATIKDDDGHEALVGVDPLGGNDQDAPF